MAIKTHLAFPYLNQLFLIDFFLFTLVKRGKKKGKPALPNFPF
ncbi:hypothetical protein NC99_25740 [Sunxiuqinia dokdonensis]|uniref:Uncharacterized protein n=1 Tax=Sunxiuqinia dokdonensis TaxID=1409788 RepID=A0A0L8V820_9BACT|nr:hypothetical protein NC99_25740 [Sunxiuqinia dokdonensis]